MATDRDPAVAQIVSLLAAEADGWYRLLDQLGTALVRDLGRQPAKRGSGRKVDELSAVADRARRIVAAGHVFGCGFIAAPDAFDDAPGLMWMTRDLEAGAPTRLRVDAEFYGYTTAPWWLNATGDDLDHTTGPYVDASGTNQYIVTCSRRVVARDEIVGVLAVDVLVSQIQRLLQAALRHLPLGSCVVDADNAVLATNTGRLLGETRSATEPRRREVAVAVPGWRLVVGTRRRPARLP